MSKSSQSITQQQQLGLRLNPQQVRFGRLLEMSAPEFEEEVTRALEENPALEAVDPGRQISEMKDDEGNDFTETADDLQRADYGSDDEIPSYRLHAANSSADDAYCEPVAVESGPSGFAALEAQLADFETITPLEREAARYVLGNLDSNGYLTRTPQDIVDDLAMGAGMDVPLRVVENALGYVRRLEPHGLGAYDLRDCLLLQLNFMPYCGTVNCATEILRDHFDLFAKKHFDKLAAATDFPPYMVTDAIKLIRTLNPRPGAAIFGSEDDDRTRHITPDFNIEVDPSGKATVSLAGHIPELAVEESFMLPGSNAAAETFISERRAAAAEFISMASRRASTLMSVMTAIVKLQPEYFRTFDRSDLRPMVLRDIKELTGLDLSVISRATASKYAMTPDGMVSLKSLFSESLGEDADVSSHGIEAAIRRLIENEDKQSPLSDEAICNALQQSGMPVARRTVAKYRERMGFPVARLRKE